MIRSFTILVLIVAAAAAIHAQAPPDILAFTAPLNIEFMSDPVSPKLHVSGAAQRGTGCLCNRSFYLSARRHGMFLAILP